MSLVLSRNGTIYESTPLNITCTATLPSVVNTPVSAMVSWMNPSDEIITSANDSRVIVLPAEMISINTFESVMIFYPVDNGDEGPFDDEGKYTCEMNIISTNALILNGVNNISENITIEGTLPINKDNNNNNNDNNKSTDIQHCNRLSSFLEIPPLELNISTSGYTEVGLSLNMTCSVRVVEGLVEQPNVAWMKMDDVSMGDLDELNITTVTVTDGILTNVTVILDRVLLEHRGVYICMAEFNTSLTYDGDSDSRQCILIIDCKLLIILFLLNPPLLSYQRLLSPPNNVIVFIKVVILSALSNFHKNNIFLLL